MPEEPPSDRRALVTGATGFVGGHLARRLAREGWDVHCLIRPASQRRLLADRADRLILHSYDGGAGALQRIVRESAPTIVFHLASLFLGEHQPEQVGALVDSNVRFGAELLEAMANGGVHRLVNTGTAWQHFDAGQTDEYCPVNLYAATKQAFESLFAYYQQTSGLSVITLKLFDTYGPDDPRPKLLALLARAARGGEELEMSPGGQLINLVHIDDVCAAYLLAAARLLAGDAPKGEHEQYAVAGEGSLTLRQLAQVYEESTGQTLPIRWAARPYRQREVMIPWEGGQPLPGWRPLVQLRDGLQTLHPATQ